MAENGENLEPQRPSRRQEDKQPVLAGLKASEICCKCGQPHRGKPGGSDCSADSQDNTPLLPGAGLSEEKEEEDKGNDEVLKSDTETLAPAEALDWRHQTDLYQDLDEQAPEDFVGHTLAERYTLLSLIGKGGMSAVFRAKDLKLNKILAVKLLLPHLVSVNLNARRFKIEAQAASSLYHPNLISTHDYGVSDRGMPYIVMDLLEGKSLSELLKEESPISSVRALPIFIQIADALAHAHGKNVLHRDLKPSNVMLTTNSNSPDFVQLVDFGIAKMLPAGDDKDGGHDLTRTGEIFGSPQYMSPEQCSSMPMDARSDIYSMGCLMYEVLTGAPPFKGDNIMDTLFKQIHEAPPDMKTPEGCAEISQSLKLIVYRCLAKEPAERYQSAAELSEELNRINQSATDIFIKQVQAKWQVFKLKRRPLRKAEKRYILISAALTVLLGLASIKLASDYCSLPEGTNKLSLKQAFMPIVQEAPEMPMNKQIMLRALETGFTKRVERLGPNPDRAAVEELIDAAEKVAQSYLNAKEYALAIHYYQVNLELAARYGNEKTYSATFPKLKIGSALYAQAKYAESIPYFKEFSQELEKMQFGLRDRSYLLEALIYKASAEYGCGRYEEAARTYERVFRTIPKADMSPSRVQLALLYSQYADCQRLRKEYGAAIEAYDKALSLYRKIPSIRTSGDGVNYNRYLLSLYLKGYCQYRLLKLEAAEKTYKEALPLLKSLPETQTNLRATASAQLSDILWQKGAYIEALQMRSRAKELSK